MNSYRITVDILCECVCLSYIREVMVLGSYSVRVLYLPSRLGTRVMPPHTSSHERTTTIDCDESWQSGIARHCFLLILRYWHKDKAL